MAKSELKIPDIDLTKPINSAELLAKVRGEKYTPPPPTTLEDHLDQLTQKLDELNCRVEDVQDEWNEWKHDMEERVLELEHRVADIEKYAEGE